MTHYPNPRHSVTISELVVLFLENLFTNMLLQEHY